MGDSRHKNTTHGSACDERRQPVRVDTCSPNDLARRLAGDDQRQRLERDAFDAAGFRHGYNFRPAPRRDAALAPIAHNGRIDGERRG